MNAVLILASIIVVGAGAFGLGRAYRTRTEATAYIGVALVALGCAIGAMRVHERTPAVVLIAIAVAANVAGMMRRGRAQEN